jgi:hypothetical protein
LQHKEQLGGNRYIEKVRLFKPSGASLPYLLFYVAPNAALGETGTTTAGAEDEKFPVHMVERGTGGRNVVREHLIYM